MKKGFALITVLAVLIMIALGAAAILQSVGNQTIMKSNNLQDVKAQFLAEAGMEYALWKCRPANGGCVNNVTYSIDGITVSIHDVTKVSTVGTPDVFAIQVQVQYTDIQNQA